MSTFRSRLNYSFGNEDWNTEYQALNIRSDSQVVCVTASGDRPLNLLLDNPKKVISIDINPIQNYLLSLKITAMRHLDYDHYLSFLGATQDKHRMDCLKFLVKNMDSESAQYWLQNQSQIEKGILYQGMIEQWTTKISAVANFIRRNKIRKLFEFDNLEEQRVFIKNEWDRFTWRKAIHMIGDASLFIRFFLNDPGLYAQVDRSIRPGYYIYQRVNDGLMNYLARESSLLSLILLGRVATEAYPPYLQETGFHIIKQRLDRISYKTTDVIKFLEESAAESFDRFSLSDVASYISKREFQGLMHAVYRTAKPHARFSIREFMSRQTVPQDLEKCFQRNSITEQQLEKEDRCFVYRFMVGTVKKKS